MNDVVKMGKCGCVSPAIWLVQGDTRSHILTIRVPRMESGVDLKDLAWKINITNEAGVDDVDVPVMGSVVIDERTIAFDWLIHGVATAVPGKTIYSVVGVDETEDGKPIIWRSDSAMIYIREKHDATPSEEVETELGELEKMIVYVNGELTNVIAAGEMARSAATHPPIIGDNGNWFLWDLEKEIYVDSGMNTRGPKGDAGYTPVKDKDYFDGKDGYTPQKGIDYTDGKDGFSPTVKVTQTADGARIDITDKNGTTSAAVKHGKDGGGEPEVFWVKIEYKSSRLTLDKTDDEIMTAYKDGKIVMGLYLSYVMPLTYCWLPTDDSTDYSFAFLTLSNGNSTLMAYVTFYGGNRNSGITEETLALYNVIMQGVPNPEPLTISAPNGDAVEYTGETPKSIAIKTVPWDAITDKPFEEKVTQILPMLQTEGVVLEPFELVEGRKYKLKITLNGEKYEEVEEVAKASSYFGNPVTYLGNLVYFGMEDTGERYLLGCIPEGFDLGGGLTVYGIANVRESYGENTVAVFELTDLEEVKTIDPKYLPTMSETTKGGAMVGKGLKMDGDALTVDEGEWELIEEIIVGYELLTAKPEDWETSWTEYHVRTVDSHEESTFSQITAETPPEWENGKYYKSVEAISTINRTAEPNGKKYNIKAVWIEFEIPTATDNGYVTIAFYTADANGGVYIANGVKSASKSFYHTFALPLYGYINGWATSPITGKPQQASFAGPLNHSGLYLKANPFVRIRIQTKSEFPAGSIIKIRTVRA